ncbi:MAG: SpoIIE family protein phosphatase [Verrucomicrobiae bacterium]|nr:SpoIIE family protein phosphatase [Verrucomicrobiae bacterium]
MNADNNSSLQMYRGLLRVSCVINSIHDYRQLLTSLLEITKEFMNCEAGSIMLYDESANDLVWHVALGEKADALKKLVRLKMGQGVAGWVAQEQKSALVADVASDSRFFRGADTKTGFQTRSIVCVPLLVGQKLVGVLQALNPRHKNHFDELDLEVFEAYGALAATAIEKTRWQDAMLQRQKLDQELEIAKEIQDRFLARCFTNAEAVFQLAFHYNAASQIGGDFYDVQDVQNNRHALILGDVSGKGVPASLLMAQILSEFRHFAHNEPNPGIILAHLNEYLCQQSTRGMFATAWCAVVHPEGCNLVMAHANAGHLPPIRFSSNNSHMIEMNSGMPLGILPGITYQPQKLHLARGELFCAYTDGVTEDRNAGGEEYGRNRLQQILASHFHDVATARNALLQSLDEFGGNAPQRDDTTFLILGPK